MNEQKIIKSITKKLTREFTRALSIVLAPTLARHAGVKRFRVVYKPNWFKARLSPSLRAILFGSPKKRTSRGLEAVENKTMQRIKSIK
jgi:hypothetical protein